MEIISNNYSIIELLNMIERNELIVNRDYQRGADLWPTAPSAYFIDTIINKYTFPKIYIYEYMDRSRRTLKKEIVDGQQRIGAIQRFHDNKLALREHGPLKGKLFRDLDDELQNQFLSYSVPVDVIRNASQAQILQMFRRMNAYTMPLNAAEKRHSQWQGAFKWFVNDIASAMNEFFVEYGVFTKRQITRMADAAFICECVYAFEHGIVSSSPAELNGLYRKYETEFDEADLYFERLQEIANFVINSFSSLRKSFMMKPYALHSLFTALYHCKYGIQEIENELGISSPGRFPTGVEEIADELFAMAQAHEGKEESGPHEEYVWGCLSTTDRKARRTARVVSLLAALGLEIPR